tara:strand:- start:240 stop:413 length:174 start_codon:yes stop_codon:yes gene_type:complete
MDTPQNELPEPKIKVLNNVKIIKKRAKDKAKKEKPRKYLDQLFKKDDKFLKEYFEEK